MIAQVVAIVTMPTCYCLSFFICENLSFTLKAKDSLFSYESYPFLFGREDDLFNVDVLITMAAWH